MLAITHASHRLFSSGKNIDKILVKMSSSNNQPNPGQTGQTNDNNNNDNNGNNDPKPNEGLEMVVDTPQPNTRAARQQRRIDLGHLQGSQNLGYQPDFGPQCEDDIDELRPQFPGRGRYGYRGRSGPNGRGGPQNQGTRPRSLNVEQQVLGKRDNTDRETDDVRPIKKFPVLKDGEFTVNTNPQGEITGLKPNNPRQIGSSVGVKNPVGRGFMAQANPFTTEGRNFLSNLAEVASLGSSSRQVVATFAAADDIGIGNQFERIFAPSNASNTQPAVLPLRALQRQNQGQNQNQNRDRPRNQNQANDRPVLCILCQSKVHTTGRCPIPTSVHHGDTAVCPLHNSTNKYPQRGHIFDCASTRPNSTCRLVVQAHNGIERASRIEGEQGLEEGKRHWDFLIQHLVVDRQHRAPLRVEDHTLDFIEVVLEYSYLYYGGGMPPQVNFVWPYTKAEARVHVNALRRFDTVGVDGMPKSILDGKTMDEIRTMHSNQEFQQQVYRKFDPKAENPGPGRPEPQPHQTGDGQGGNASTAMDVDESNEAGQSLIDRAQAELSKVPIRNQDSNVTGDVTWDDIPKYLQLPLFIASKQPTCPPEVKAFIEGAQGEGEATLGVNAQMFRKGLHDFAAKNKLPTNTIYELKKLWPLSAPL